MFTPYAIRCFKDSSRLSPGKMSGVEARFVYKELIEFTKALTLIYGEGLEDTSILISINEREIYRSKERMKEFSILMVDDLLSYLGVEHPTYVIKNNEPVTDMHVSISDAYVLEVYTKDHVLTNKQLKRLSEVYGNG